MTNMSWLDQALDLEEEEEVQIIMPPEMPGSTIIDCGSWNDYGDDQKE